MSSLPCWQPVQFPFLPGVTQLTQCSIICGDKVGFYHSQRWWMLCIHLMWWCSCAQNNPPCCMQAPRHSTASETWALTEFWYDSGTYRGMGKQTSPQTLFWVFILSQLCSHTIHVIPVCCGTGKSICSSHTCDLLCLSKCILQREQL